MFGHHSDLKQQTAQRKKSSNLRPVCLVANGTDNKQQHERKLQQDMSDK